MIALSAGGANTELSVDGIGMDHVEELMVRIAMKLLADGHHLAFGGTLGRPGETLAEHLIQVALNQMNEQTASRLDVRKPETWPLTNYSPWPNHLQITEEMRARLVGVCRFIDVDPPGASASALKSWDWDAALGGRSLSEMRLKSSQESDLRIVWSGKIDGGGPLWTPGILEEAAFSLHLGKPVLIFGRFGGCARLIADYLLDPKASWPFPDRRRMLGNPRLPSGEDVEIEGLFRAYRRSLQAPQLSGWLELARQALEVRSERLAVSLAAQAAARGLE